MDAILYAAKSTKDVHDSIPTQLQQGRELAQRNGRTVVAELQDEAASAYHGDRGPGLAKAMTESDRLASEGHDVALIVQHSDRLARGDAKQARHLIEVVLWAIKSDVQLLSVQDPEMLAGGDMALLMGAIGGMRNNQDSKRKSESVKDGVRRAAEQRGQFIGGRRPYGYRRRYTNDKTGRPTGPLVIDQAEAAVVRYIFSEFVAGRSQNHIARRLEHDKVSNLTPNGSWYASTVLKMLTNPLYIGRVRHRGVEYSGGHQPIIDSDTWKQAQRLREARKAQGRPRGRRTAGLHLLTEKLLICTCGAPMSPRTKRAAGQTYDTYQCLSRLYPGPSECRQKPLKRADIDGAIFDYFESVALDVDATRSAFVGQAGSDLADTTARQQRAEHDVAKIDESLARVEGDYLAGKLSAEKWERLEARLLSERDGARAEAEQCDRRRQAIEAQIEAVDTEAAVLEELAALRRLVAGKIRQGKSGDLDQLRAVLRRLFVGFELASPNARFGSGALRGVVWVGSEARKNPLGGFSGGSYLIPRLRPDAIVLECADPAGFPAVERVALSRNFMETTWPAS
jgi:DNA invertase Pin-like site-specific DNA recombinase